MPQSHPFKSIPILKNKNGIPLSYTQQRFWFLENWNPHLPVNNRSVVFDIRGILDIDILKRSLNHIIQRHEILRTKYMVSQDTPCQMVQDKFELEMPVVDLTKFPEDQITIELERNYQEITRKRFVLDRDLLIRFNLYKLDDAHFRLLFTTHHINFDAWSENIFLGELIQNYQALSHNSPVSIEASPLQYSDFSLWQAERINNNDLSADFAYWLEYLKGDLPVIEIPGDYRRQSIPDYSGDWVEFTINSDLSGQLKHLSRSENVSLFMVLLSAYQIWLSRYSGQSDLILGYLISGKIRSEIEPLIGPFVNLLLLRNNLDSRQTFKQLIRQTRQLTLEAYTHQELPFEKLVEVINPERDIKHTPLCQVLFNFKNLPPPSLSESNVTFSVLKYNRKISPFDLTLEMYEHGDKIEGHFEYRTDLYTASTVAKMVEHYIHLLKEAVSSPEKSISKLSFLSTKERKTIIQESIAAKLEESNEFTLDRLFEQQARTTPDAPALKFGDEVITYQCLDQSANRMANILRENGVSTESLVGLMLDRSPVMMIALLAIVKAGGAYIPISTTVPIERLKVIIEDTHMSVILSSNPSKVRHIGHDELIVFSESEIFDQINKHSDSCPEKEHKPGNLAYILYTSGSTGLPKGVCVEHRQICHYIDAISKRLKFPKQSRFAMVQPLTVDSSQTVIFPAWVSGGCIDLIPETMTLDAHALAQYFISNPPQIMKIAPSHLRALIEYENYHSILPERMLILGGEALNWDLLRKVQSVNKCQTINHYGPTETCVGVLVNDVSQLKDNNTHLTVPIGSPLSDVGALIMDQDLNLVPDGIPGELIISGPLVTRGYLNRDSENLEKFIKPEISGIPSIKMYRTGDRVVRSTDGSIEFLGRMDQQIKIRGFRVEPGEIESLISKHPAVQAAAVLADKKGNDQLTLTAYVVPKEGLSVSGNELRSFLSTQLPEYMVPTTYSFLKALPLNAHGKLNRLALPEMEIKVTRDKVKPKEELSQLEKRLVDIWESVLNIKGIDVNDNFFDLGGHSLTAIQLIIRITKLLGLQIPLETVFQVPTIAGQVQYIQDRQIAQKWRTIIPIRQEGSRLPFICVSPSVIDVITYQKLVEHLDPDQPFYALYPKLPREALDKDRFVLYIDAIRSVQSHGPYLLGGYSGGGKIAIEIAKRLQKENEEIAEVILLDTYAPGYPKLLPWVTPRIYNFLKVIQRIRSYWWKFSSLDWQSRWDLFSTGQQPGIKRIQKWVSNRFKELKIFVPEADLGVVQASRIIDQPSTSRYSGNIVLFRSKINRMGVTNTPTMGWSDWVDGEIRVVAVEGDHETILFGKRIPQVAHFLQGFLDAAIR